MPNGWRTINSLVHKIRLHGRRGKGMAESFSRQKSRHAPQKEGGLKILCDLPPVWPRLVRPTNLMSRMDGKKTHTHTHRAWICQQCAWGAADNINEISERGDTGSRETMRVSRTAYETKTQEAQGPRGNDSVFACRAGGLSVDMAAKRQSRGKPAILPTPLVEPDDHNVDETCEFSTLAFVEHLYDHSDCSAATCSWKSQYSTQSCKSPLDRLIKIEPETLLFK